MRTHNYTKAHFDYNITLAGDPEFNGEIAAERCGLACLQKSDTSMGLLDLCELPKGFVLHHGRLETIDETGIRKVAGLTIEGPDKIRFNTATLTLQRL